MSDCEKIRFLFSRQGVSTSSRLPCFNPRLVSRGVGAKAVCRLSGFKFCARVLGQLEVTG